MILFNTIAGNAVQRIASPYSPERGSLVYWRARILFAILFTALTLGVFATIAGIAVAIKENAWGLLVFDCASYLLCIYLIASKRLRYEIRASITLIMFYAIGIAVLLSVGPLSGFMAWLFAFAVLVAVLLGYKPAIAAICLNAGALACIAWLIVGNRIEADFIFFASWQAMIAAGVNFLALNVIDVIVIR